MDEEKRQPLSHRINMILILVLSVIALWWSIQTALRFYEPNSSGGSAPEHYFYRQDLENDATESE